jgi:chorismate-pyruvate lyase
VPETTPPAIELDSLVRLFYREPANLGDFAACASETMPPIYRQLLAHNAHMTVTVEQRHGCSVDVEVLDSWQKQSHYCRKILLRRQSDHRVVQFGIVRLDLDLLEEQPRKEILAKKIPLGRVLIQHNVMRQVQLVAVWRVSCGNELANYFEVAPGQVTYGRTALIYCDGEPAIELLEIVAPE